MWLVKHISREDLAKESKTAKLGPSTDPTLHNLIVEKLTGRHNVEGCVYTLFRP